MPSVDTWTLAILNLSPVEIVKQTPGAIIDGDMPIDASNVMIVCPSCGPTRIAHKIDAEGHKRRVCRKCGGDL